MAVKLLYHIFQLACVHREKVIEKSVLIYIFSTEFLRRLFKGGIKYHLTLCFAKYLQVARKLELIQVLLDHIKAERIYSRYPRKLYKILLTKHPDVFGVFTEFFLKSRIQLVAHLRGGIYGECNGKKPVRGDILLLVRQQSDYPFDKYRGLTASCRRGYGNSPAV